MNKVAICKKIKQPTGYNASVTLSFHSAELFAIPQKTLLEAVEAERLIGKP